MEYSLWTERYRPEAFKDVKGQKDIVKRVKAFVEQQNMPHLLFAGPAGTGKTTLALVVVKQLYKDTWRENFLELNASDERGIDVVRVKVKEFARTKALGNVPFKIIYLDECLDYNSLITIKKDAREETLKIGDFVEKKDFSDVKVLSVDDNKELTYVDITQSIKIPHDPAKGFYDIAIHDKKIRATGNHLLLTPSGWRAVEDLKRGDLVLCPLANLSSKEAISATPISATPIIYELVGLPQEIKRKERYIQDSPEKKIIELLSEHNGTLSRQELTKKSGVSSSKISGLLTKSKNEYYISLVNASIVDYDGQKIVLKQTKHEALSKLYSLKRTQRDNTEYVMTELRSKGVYPLPIDKAVVAAKLVGHLLSDGSLSLKAKQLFFSGKEEDMKIIKNDMNKLGFYGLGNIRYSQWKKGECWSFGAYRIDVLSFFYSLGVPVGRKTDTPYTVPKWILESENQDIKRAFLSAFFGGEGSCLKFQGRTLKPIVLAQHKIPELLEDVKAYLEQVRSLLKEFDVDSRLKISNQSCTRKDGTKTVRAEIIITNARRNIIKFIENVGYSYCRYKEEVAVDTYRYLLWKESLGKAVYSFRPVPHFNKWKEYLQHADMAYHYVTNIKKIEDPKWVYCLSTENQKFIANNIVVHNCDALTREAQQALRRTMENYSQTCRFILSCNYSSKIIEPIQSRCAVFRFKPLSKDEIFEIIDIISLKEKISIDEKAKFALVEVSEGDVRKLENIMQACAVLSLKITEEIVFEVAGYARPKEIGQILEYVVKKDFEKAKTKLLDTMLNYGLSGIDIIKQLHKEVWKLSIPDLKKLEMMKDCAEIEFRMVEGSDEFLQLESLIARFILTVSK